MRTNKRHRYKNVDELKQKIVAYLQVKRRTDCDEGKASCTEISRRLNYHNQYVAKVLADMQVAGQLIKENRNSWRLANESNSNLSS